MGLIGDAWAHARACAAHDRYVEVARGCVAGAQESCACGDGTRGEDGARDAYGTHDEDGKREEGSRRTAASACTELATFRSLYTSRDGWYALYEDCQGHLTSVNTARLV